MFHLVINGMFPRHETDRLLPKLFNSQERHGELLAIFKMSVIPTNILTQPTLLSPPAPDPLADLILCPVVTQDLRMETHNK